MSINVKKLKSFLFISMCCMVIWLIYRLKATQSDLDAAYSAHAETLEYVIAAQLALKDGRPEAVPLANTSLDKSKAISALYFSKNKIFHKDIMFIMEFNNKELIESLHLDKKQKKIIHDYIEKSRNY
jgi:hypothetical protein